MLEKAGLQSEEINYMLKQAGPITDENRLAGRTEITEFFKLNKR
jgi:hypothetical protein